MPYIAAIAAAATSMVETMDKITSQPRNEPWPSLDAASWLFDRSSFVLFISLSFGAISTLLIVWMGIVKERHWDILRERSNERIAELNKETHALKADAEASRVKISQAAARALEAKLELEKFRAPRVLSTGSISHLIQKMKKFGAVRFDTAAIQDPEALSLLLQIEDALSAAGWQQIDWDGSAVVHARGGRKVAGIVGAQDVIVQVAQSNFLTMQFPGSSLAVALQDEGVEAKYEGVRDGTTARKTTAIHVAVGRK